MTLLRDKARTLTPPATPGTDASDIFLPPALSAPVPRPSFFGRLLSGGRGRMFWTLADQGIASVGNFLTSNQLARHLPQDQYGTFGTVLETLLFFNSLQAALVIYPMTMKRAHDQSRLRQTATTALMLTLALLPLLGSAMGMATYFAAQGGQQFVSAGATATLALATVGAMFLWQGQELMRRALMADLRFGAAIPGDAISYLGQFVWIFILAHTSGHGGASNLTLTSALVAIGATSAIAMIVQALQVGLAPVRLADVRVMAGEYWRLGRWNLGANLTTVITSLGYIWTLKQVWGAAAVATFAAICLLLKLVNPLMTSMGNLIVPAVARVARTSPRQAIRIAMKYGAVGGAMIAPYCLAVMLLPTLALNLLYGRQSPYVQYGSFLRMAMVNYFLIYVCSVISATLNGLGRTRDNFKSQCGYVAATLAIGLPCTFFFQVYGVLWGSFVAIVVSLLINLRALYRASSTATVNP